jgi:hypothetical protein
MIGSHAGLIAAGAPRLPPLCTGEGTNMLGNGFGLAFASANAVGEGYQHQTPHLYADMPVMQIGSRFQVQRPSRTCRKRVAVDTRHLDEDTLELLLMDRLTGDKRADAEDHLSKCWMCRRFARHEREAIRLIKLALTS